MARSACRAASRLSLAAADKAVPRCFRIPPERLTQLAAQPELISIQPYLEPHKMDERQGMIMAGNLTGNVPTGPGYLSWLASKGFSQSQFTASGFAVDVSDSGLDNGTSSPGHFGLYQLGNSAQTSRVVYNRLMGSPNSGSPPVKQRSASEPSSGPSWRL